MESGLKDIFLQVEKYVMPIIGNDPSSHFSKDETRILALQHINRLNQKIGQLARGAKDQAGQMKILQTYINRLTIGVKNDNIPQIRSSLASAKSYIDTMEQI